MADDYTNDINAMNTQWSQMPIDWQPGENMPWPQMPQMAQPYEQMQQSQQWSYQAPQNGQIQAQQPYSYMPQSQQNTSWPQMPQSQSFQQMSQPQQYQKAPEQQGRQMAQTQLYRQAPRNTTWPQMPQPQSYQQMPQMQSYPQTSQPQMSQPLGMQARQTSRSTQNTRQQGLAQQARQSQPSQPERRRPRFNEARYHKEYADPEYQDALEAIYAGNVHRGMDLLDECYQYGNILAGVMLGEILCNTMDKGRPRYDQQEGVRCYEDGSRIGYPLADALLADAYAHGHGVPRDKARARELWHTCKAGLYEMVKVGDMLSEYMYADGLRVYDGAPDKAAPLYEHFLSCSANSVYAVKAAYRLARMYLYGQGQDPARGVEILEQALEWFPDTQDISLHYELGRSYFDGCVGVPDYARALRHLKVSAKKGDAHSLYYMGELYYYGLGIPADQSTALMYYNWAADQNYKPAVLRLGDIYSS